MSMNVQSGPSISVFFPAYNDAGTIASMVLSAIIVLETFTHDYEVIVINDGSSDHTREILDRLAKDYDHVRVIHHERNRGYGGALRTGFNSAEKDLIFYTDGDAQYDVWELKRLYSLLTDEVDMVQGYKANRADGLSRKVIGRTYKVVAKILFGLRVIDVDCDFRLLRRRVLSRITLTRNSGVICVELVRKIQDAGFRIVETKVNHYPRVYGQSQFFRLRPIIRTFRDLIDLWVDLILCHKGAEYDDENVDPRLI